MIHALNLLEAWIYSSRLATQNAGEGQGVRLAAEDANPPGNAQAEGLYFVLTLENGVHRTYRRA